MEGKGCVHTSSPGSPRTGLTGVVEHVDRHAEAQRLQLAAPDGPRRVAEGEAGDDVRAARDRSQMQVVLDGAVDVLETFRRERRAGGRHSAERAEVVGALGLEPGLGGGVEILGGGAEERHALRVGIIEQGIAVGMKGRAVIEQQRRLGGERTDQPVPHHPAASGGIEHPVAPPDIAVQRVLLHVLQQRAAGAVDDALGRAGGARGKHDHQRVVEGHPHEVDRPALFRCKCRAVEDGVTHAVERQALSSA